MLYDFGNKEIQDFGFRVLSHVVFLIMCNNKYKSLKNDKNDK